MRRAVVLLPLSLLFAASSASAANIPVLTPDVPAGGGTTPALRAAHDDARTIDGDPADWGGSLPGFGGALFYSRGELVYEDHIFDAYGADNGQDAQRMSIEDPAQALVPETYRIDPALQYVPEEFGIPTGPFTWSTHYGDLEHQDQADLSQVRLGTDARGDLELLARTTTMSEAKPGSALLVLLDTKPGDTSRAIGFGSGLSSTKADSAIFLFGDKGIVQDLATGTTSPLAPGSVETDASGYTNSIEARIPITATDSLGVAVAS